MPASSLDRSSKSFNKLEQAIATDADPVEIVVQFRLAVLIGARFAELGERQDGVHRRTQFVRHVGEEFRLDPIGELGFVARGTGLTGLFIDHFAQMIAVARQFGFGLLTGDF